MAHTLSDATQAIFNKFGLVRTNDTITMSVQQFDSIVQHVAGAAAQAPAWAIPINTYYDKLTDTFVQLVARGFNVHGSASTFYKMWWARRNEFIDYSLIRDRG